MDRRSFFKSLAVLVVARPFIRKLKPIGALDPPYSKRGLVTPQPAFDPKSYYGEWKFVTIGPAPFPYNAGETIR